MNIISESGLYTLILRSRKAEAKPFRRWVTHEVLPAIRKTGAYQVTSQPSPDLLQEIHAIKAELAEVRTKVFGTASQSKLPEPDDRRAMVTSFLEACCMPVPNTVTPFQALYKSYVRWMGDKGFEADSSYWFGKLLQKSGYLSVQIQGVGAHRLGIRLVHPSHPENDMKGNPA